MDERIDESVLQWLSHVERRRNDRITTRVFVGKCVGSCSVGRPRKMLIDTMKEC